MPIKVPRVILDDPNVEPTDEELELLMRAVQESVIERAEKAREQQKKKMADAIAEGFKFDSHR
ncbi:MAG: hypothetical protein OXH90_10915 [Paracoccaceae bacterium]|nr:hypothetical protein [Paracoccaceae bacterium]MDE2738127.1 hypothetical protein [Paracoccaceae bacterium]MDE2760791.1 hypothetical protein [Paracoccaceae bacterium]MDE2917174.1 hypothetical protein [Paracoccaceae bacterium]